MDPVIPVITYFAIDRHGRSKVPANSDKGAVDWVLNYKKANPYSAPLLRITKETKEVIWQNK